MRSDIKLYDSHFVQMFNFPKVHNSKFISPVVSDMHGNQITSKNRALIKYPEI
jgi:hypothetical protein